jgi:hypothetical protein
MRAHLYRVLQRAPWLGICLALGLGLRIYHYLLCPSVWHDEAALIVNALHKGFREQLGPLQYAEAAPPLFLWVERALSLLVNDSVWALRAVPLLASCAALVLLARVARRALSPQSAPWAVLLLGVSNHVLWHSCEAKPYALDILAAILLIDLVHRPAAWTLTSRVLLLAALAPAIIWLSFPGCFLYGGVLIVLLPPVWRQRRLTLWLAYGLLTLAVFVAFALLLGPIRAQRHATMDGCWVAQFPNWSRPWTVPVWAVCSTVDLVRYCFEPTGHGLALAALAGGIALWRGGQRELVLLVLLPLDLAFGASLVHAYPYGGARVEVFAAPGLALLIAAGIPPIWTWLRTRQRLAPLVLTAMLLWPAGLADYRVVRPWARPDSAGAASFVLAQRRPDEPVFGNSWQDSYYFRSLGTTFQLFGRSLRETHQCFWLVWSEEGQVYDDCRASTYLLGGGRILCRREFTGTTVYHCEPGLRR